MEAAQIRQQEMPSAETVARFFVRLASQGEPVPLTPMHVQKLLYYAQGWHLGTRGQPLFPDDIQAWRFGPVVPAVYDVFKPFARRAIPPEEGRSGDDLRPELGVFLKAIWKKYRRHSAAALVSMTHREPPWKNAWGQRDKSDRSRELMSPRALDNYFRPLYAAHCRALGVDPTEFAESLDQAARGEVVDLMVVKPKPAGP